MTIRVLVVDDQAIVRSGLRLALSDEPDIAVVGEAADGRQALEVAAVSRPAVVLMDVRMPALDGISATDALLASGADVKVLMLSTFAEDEYVFASLRAGASGYPLKDAEPRDIAAAIRAVDAGDAVTAPSITRRLVEAALAGAAPAPRVEPPLTDVLSPRELEVLELLAAGLSNHEIASRLYLSEPTIKSHVSALLGKLGLRSRVQAVILAYETGLVTPTARRVTPSGD